MKRKPDNKYQSILIRMYLVETIGECIYNALSVKASNEEMTAAYKRLSLNETETSDLIVNEMKRLGLSAPAIRKGILRAAAFIVFSVLSYTMLENLLKKTLKKSIFKSWFTMCHEYNEKFWQSMLDHEALQYTLLNL